MKYLVTSEEMKKYDNNTIKKIGISGMVLMERAALTVFEQIEKRFAQKGVQEKRVMILAGMGNNGGDGLALARLLSEQGYEVMVWCVGNEEKASAQWKQQREILRSYNLSDFAGNYVTVVSKEPNQEYNILVDALFGVGLSREVSGEYAEAVDVFNRRGGYKIAIDVPSGLDADTGSVLGCAVRANLTITFGFCKRGLVLYPGCEYAGEVVTTSIGISERSFLKETPTMFYYDEPLGELLPVRSQSGNKGTFGKVLLVAGSVNMAGAAILAAKAAYRAGAGMVKVITPAKNRIIIQTAIPEALLGTTQDLANSLEWADVVVIGPGMGKDKVAKEGLKTVIANKKLPLIIDADGLNLLAEDKVLQQDLATREGEVILTPHVGELSRLMGEGIPTLKEDLSHYGKLLAKRLHGIVVAKDARTFICKEDAPVCVNIRGNSGMATAGSGDVLAGVIAGLLAQHKTPFEAAAIGVYLHAYAGDCAAKQLGEHAVMAGDIVEKIGYSPK